MDDFHGEEKQLYKIRALEEAGASLSESKYRKVQYTSYPEEPDDEIRLYQETSKSLKKVFGQMKQPRTRDENEQERWDEKRMEKKRNYYLSNMASWPGPGWLPEEPDH